MHGLAHDAEPTSARARRGRAARGRPDRRRRRSRALLLDVAPDEVYNLAALSSVAQSWARAGADRRGQPALAAAALLERRAVQERHGRPVRFVQASSAEIFGEPPTSPQDESTPIRAGEPVRRREGLRPPAGRRLPRAAACTPSRDPLQPRVAAPAPDASSPARSPATVAAIARGERRPAGPRQPRRPPRLGLGAGLRRRDGARRPRRRAAATTSSPPARATRSRDFVGRRVRARRHRRLGAVRRPTRRCSARPTRST